MNRRSYFIGIVVVGIMWWHEPYYIRFRANQLEQKEDKREYYKKIDKDEVLFSLSLKLELDNDKNKERNE
jgi:hypothetical protein